MGRPFSPNRTGRRIFPDAVLLASNLKAELRERWPQDRQSRVARNAVIDAGVDRRRGIRKRRGPRRQPTSVRAIEMGKSATMDRRMVRRVPLAELIRTRAPATSARRRGRGFGVSADRSASCGAIRLGHGHALPLRAMTRSDTPARERSPTMKQPCAWRPGDSSLMCIRERADV